MIECTPAASDKAHAVRGRESNEKRILARLEAGPVDSYELARIGGIRFGARLFNLRRAGHVIEREDFAEGGREWSRYSLKVTR